MKQVFVALTTALGDKEDGSAQSYGRELLLSLWKINMMERRRWRGLCKSGNSVGKQPVSVRWKYSMPLTLTSCAVPIELEDSRWIQPVLAQIFPLRASTIFKVFIWLGIPMGWERSTNDQSIVFSKLGCLWLVNGFKLYHHYNDTINGPALQVVVNRQYQLYAHFKYKRRKCTTLQWRYTQK